MEKFAVDLDKVLDDFELNEDLASIEIDKANLNSYKRQVISHSTSGLNNDSASEWNPSPWGTANAVSLYDDPNSAAPMIDLSDADFSAVPLCISSSNKSVDTTLEKDQDDGDSDINKHGDFPSSCLNGLSSIAQTINGGIDSLSNVDEEDLPELVCTKNNLVSASVLTTNNTGSGIKELHCDDEILNKDFVVTFGRKLDLKFNNSDNCTTIPKFVPQIETSVNNEPTTSQVADEKLSIASCSLSSDVLDGSNLQPGLESDQLGLFVTLDDDSGDSAVDVAPVSFHSDINVTDDELDSYLKDESEKEDDDGEEILSDSVNDDKKFGEHLLEATCDELSDDVCEEINNDRRSDDVAVSPVELVDNLENRSNSIEKVESTAQATVETSADHTSDVLCLNCPQESDDLLNDTLQSNEVPVSEHSDGNTTFEATTYPDQDAEADEGYEAGEASPPSDINTRLTRPTSLTLPGMLDYQPPDISPDCEGHLPQLIDIDEDDRLPFSSLVSTAGSPEAVSFLATRTAAEGGIADSLVEDERILGRVAPVWVPDSYAPNCMQCDVKFTVIKRRHHCRACGKVLCAGCCGMKARLRYMDNKEARVCLNCVEVMKKVEAIESEECQNMPDSLLAAAAPRSFQNVALPSTTAASISPNPNNPSEYCSKIPPLEQVQSNALPPTVMVPVGVLKRIGGRAKGEPKQVMFSDGIRPGGDLTELDIADEPVLPSRRQQIARTIRKVDQKSADNQSSLAEPCFDLMSGAKRHELSLDEPLDMNELLPILQDETAEPIVFSIAKNFCILVKIIDLECCVHKICWSFTTHGMSGVGQDEIIVLVEMLPHEKIIPTDIFRHLADVYEDASKGITVSGMGHSIFSQSFLGSREHGGFLYVRSSFQCLSKMVLPPAPYLFAVLLQKWETPWAKVFPLRLFLRLGAESRYYPCSLVGTRFRKPVYSEIGHTVMNILADFRNYQYTLPSVPGLTIHMEDKQTFVNIPRNRYDEVVKAINGSIDHVLALAATFNVQADSHLVCIQSEDGSYQTQAISIKDMPRIVTGASFIVFNGALKKATGLTAKYSIVEDGLMVQISSDSNQTLRQSLRDMKDYVIHCGPIGAEEPEVTIHLRWVDDDRNVNIGVLSPIDKMPMDGISSIRIHCGTDYVGDGLVIRWTEVYLIKTEDGHRSDPIDLGKISDCLASACCLALTPHLVDLFASRLVKIGLRVTLDSDNVGYEVGACGEKLSPRFMNDLDGELVPAIHGAAAHDGAVIVELIFHILRQ